MNKTKKKACSKERYDEGCLMCDLYNRCPVVAAYYRTLMNQWIREAFLQVP